MQGGFYQLSDGSKRVRITSIYRQDASNIAIEGEFSSAPLAAEVYRSGNVQAITIGHIEQRGTNQPVKPFIFPRALHMQARDRDDRHFFLTFSELDVPRQASGVAAAGISFYVRARLIGVWGSVDVAYSGADATSVIFVRRTSDSKNYCSMNLLTLGRRQATSFATSGAVAGDTLTLTGGDYLEQFNLLVSTGGGTYPAYTDPVQLGKFTIVAEFIRA
jgi:hypothetical protein